MALGFAATENWIEPIVQNFWLGRAMKPKPVQFGLMMKRYYAELFVPAG
jgi:carbamoyl-phosphate synthase large subunit